MNALQMVAFNVAYLKHLESVSQIEDLQKKCNELRGICIPLIEVTYYYK